MKKLLSILFFIISISASGQDIRPIDPINFKNLQSPSFSYWLNDSSVWIYKGSTYQWTKLASEKKVQYMIDSLAATIQIDTTAIHWPDTINWIATKYDLDTLSFTGEGGGKTIYTDSGTVANIPDFLLRTNPGQTFSIGNVVGVDGFEDYWNTWEPNTKFSGMFISPDHWGGLGMVQSSLPSNEYHGIEILPNWGVTIFTNSGSVDSRQANISFRNSGADAGKISLGGSATNEVYYSYIMPHTSPSLTLNDTTIMAWRGTGSSATSIGFIPLPSGGGGGADTNTTYDISAQTISGGANLRLTGSDSTTDDVKIASGYGVDVTRTDASTITLKADTTKLATQYDLTQVSGGGSIWTDEGNYAHLNGYEDIYMPSGKSISWRNTTANVTGSNSWRIRENQHFSGNGILNFEVGPSNVTGMTLFNYGSAVAETYMWLSGNMYINYGSSGSFQDHSLLPLDIYVGNYQTLSITGAGAIRQRNVTNSPPNLPANYSYWYTKNGLPFFKYGSTEYDLSSGGGGGSTTFIGLTDTPSSFSGQAGKFLKVNTGATALEFVDAPGGGGVTSVSAGNGMSFTTITSSGAVTMGTPSTITVSSTNGVSTGTHTHTLDLSGRSISGQYSITGGGNLSADRTLQLVNDATSPGASKYYGTNSSSVKGWHDLPAGGGGMTNPMTTQGDIIVGGSSGSATRLAAGASTYVLTSNGAGQVPSWQPAPTGGGTAGVTSWSGGTTGFTPNTSTQGNVTLAGTLNVSNGGTGRTSHTAYALLAGGTGTTGAQQSLATGTSGQILRSSGASTLPAWSTATYPATTMINQALYSSSNNVITSGTLPAAAGGTGQQTYSIGDLLYASGSTALSKLPIGVSGRFLRSNGSGQAPSWEAEADPKGVQSIAVTGTTTKTITVTLRDNTTTTAQFTDISEGGSSYNYGVQTFTTGVASQTWNVNNGLNGRVNLTTTTTLTLTNVLAGMTGNLTVEGGSNLGIAIIRAGTTVKVSPVLYSTMSVISIPANNTYSV